MSNNNFKLVSAKRVRTTIKCFICGNTINIGETYFKKITSEVITFSNGNILIDNRFRGAICNNCNDK